MSSNLKKEPKSTNYRQFGDILNSDKKHLLLFLIESLDPTLVTFKEHYQIRKQNSSISLI